MSKPCKCGDPVGHAKAVSSAVLQCLFNAMREPEKEAFWFGKADALESKFTTAHSKHYSLFLESTDSADQTTNSPN